jgi:hypothetical protein
MATILGLILGFLKVLPQVIELYKELKKNAEMVATQKAAQTATERFREKQNATTDFIKQHTAAAVDKLQNNTSTFYKSELQAGQQSETNKGVSTGSNNDGKQLS